MQRKRGTLNIADGGEILFAKIAALFRKLKSAISLFPYCFAELFNSAFLFDFLEIADFIFVRIASLFTDDLLLSQFFCGGNPSEEGFSPTPPS